MNGEHPDEKLDDLIHGAIGRHRPVFDFHRWQQKHRDRIDVFCSQVRQCDPPVIARTERTLMMTRTLKIATAAVILMAVLVMTSDWMRITAPAFGLEEIDKAMKRVEYGHMIWKMEESNLDAETARRMNLGGSESWTSRHPPRETEKRHDGTITCTEKDTGKVWRYDPASNVIVVEQGSPTSAEDLQMSAFDRFTKELVELEKQGAKVEYGKGVHEGRPVTIITTDYNPPGRMRSVFSLIVDPDTYLLHKLTLEQTDPKKGWRILASAVADYPDSGPTDIYEAGAPQDAKVVVADTPGARSLEVLARHDAARGSLPKRWTLIAVETDDSDIVRMVTIIYADDQKGRAEYHHLKTGVLPNTVPVSEGVKAVREWAHGQGSWYLAASLYDGQYVYHAQYYDRDGAWHRQDRMGLSGTHTAGELSGGLDLLGWASGGGRLVENAYATRRGLLCIETRDTANIQQGRIIEPARRMLYYLDPSRDFMCVRLETYQYRVLPGQVQPKVNEVAFNPSDTPPDPTLVREVVEYGRFETGQSYATRFQEMSARWDEKDAKWEPDGQKKWTRIYIQTHPEFPEGLFDPNYPGWVP